MASTEPESGVDVTEIEDVIKVYMVATKEKAKLEKLTKDLAATIKRLMGDADTATVRGVPALRQGRFKVSRFDQEAFQDDHPDLHSLYMVTVEQRRLTVVKNASTPGLD